MLKKEIKRKTKTTQFYGIGHTTFICRYVVPAWFIAFHAAKLSTNGPIYRKDGKGEFLYPSRATNTAVWDPIGSGTHLGPLKIRPLQIEDIFRGFRSTLIFPEFILLRQLIRRRFPNLTLRTNLNFKILRAYININF